MFFVMHSAFLSHSGGRGVHVVYDGVGKDTFDASLKSCGVGAYLVAFGNASGKVSFIGGGSQQGR